MTKPDWIPTNTRPYVALVGVLGESVDSATSLVVHVSSELSYVAEAGTESILRLIDMTVDLSWLSEQFFKRGVPECQPFLEQCTRVRRIVLLGRSQEEDLESLRGIGIHFGDDLISFVKEVLVTEADEVAELIMNWEVDLDVPTMIARFAKDRGLSEKVLRREFFEILPDLLFADSAFFKWVEGWKNYGTED